MKNNNEDERKWINIGIICGLLVSVIYPLLQFISNLKLGVIFAVLMGLLLSLASTGLYYFIQLHKKSITSKIALVSNIIAGAIIIEMFLVQLSIKASKPEIIDESQRWIWNSINHIHYGIDVAWDIYIFLGTLLFAISAFHHPKLGKIFSVAGIFVSIAMIVSNVATFPNPPESEGFIDFGPFIGLWYLAVTIKIVLSKKWINQELIENEKKLLNKN